MTDHIFETINWKQVPHGGLARNETIEGAARISTFGNDKAIEVEDVLSFFENCLTSDLKKINYTKEIGSHI